MGKTIRNPSINRLRTQHHRRADVAVTYVVSARKRRDQQRLRKDYANNLEDTLREKEIEFDTYIMDDQMAEKKEMEEDFMELIKNNPEIIAMAAKAHQVEVAVPCAEEVE